MAWYKKKNTDQTKVHDLSRLARPEEIDTHIKRLINASQYDFYETEAVVVNKVVLNELRNRATISGKFIEKPERFINDVKPLWPNITTVPVVGEQVAVMEYSGKWYYSTIIGKKQSINENAVPSGDIKNQKYGNTFERRKIKPIEIREGSIIFEGRFGQTIHLDSHNNTPKIKISAHTLKDNELDGEFRKESIDNDDASIYLLSRGMNDKFDEQDVNGKKVLIKSNGIFISGEDVRLGSSVETNIEPVVKGTTLKELLDPIFETQISQNETTMVENTAKIAQLAAIQPQTPQTIEEIRVLGESNINLQMMNTKLQTAINSSTYLSETVKTV